MGTESSAQGDPSTPNNVNTNGTLSLPTDNVVEKKKKKKKVWKRLTKVLTCLKPQNDKENHRPSKAETDTEGVTFRTARAGNDSDDEDVDVKEEEDLEEVAGRLTEISDEIQFVPSDIEPDGPDDDVEKVIALVLRDAGDRLYERELKDTSIACELLGNYSFFELVIKRLLDKMGLSTSNPEALGPKVSTKTQIAVTCEATSRLSVLDTLPMNRLLGHGARYLKSHFSSWAELQGGYEKAFDNEDEDDVH